MRSSSSSRCKESNGLSDAITVSLAVDNVQKFGKLDRSPGKAWPGDDEIRETSGYGSIQEQKSAGLPYYADSKDLFV